MWKDFETDEDLLGYQVQADLLSKVILDNEMLPITIGVFGNWGSGKSSLMLLIEKNISNWMKKNEKEKVLHIKFNSWQFENYDNTKLTLIQTILEKLSDDIERKKDIFEKTDDLFSKINYLHLGVLALKKLAAGIIPQNIKDILPSLEDLKGCISVENYQKLLNELQPHDTSRFVSQFRKSFEELINEAKYKVVVVYIDDLDRCAPERVIECLEAVKLFLNVEKTAFVIGADERVIEFAINDHYPLQRSNEEKKYSPFSDYLEKLIQLPYKLPKLSYNEQETYILLLLCKKHLNAQYTDVHKAFLKFRDNDKHAKFDLGEIKKACPAIDLKTVEGYMGILPLMTRFLNGNPRQLKRFLNAFDLRLQLAEVANIRESIEPEILAKLMVLEYSPYHRSLFEDLFQRQLSDGFIKGIETIEQQAKDGEITDEKWKDKWTSKDDKSWLSASPTLKDVNLRDYFWIARDSIKDEVPLEDIITRPILSLYSRLMKLMTRKHLKDCLNEELGGDKFSDDEKRMLILLLNRSIRKNPKNAQSWKILNADEDNHLIGNDINKLSNLFENVVSEEIPPSASSFFKRMSAMAEFGEFMRKLPISQQLTNALK